MFKYQNLNPLKHLEIQDVVTSFDIKVRISVLIKTFCFSAEIPHHDAKYNQAICDYANS